MATTFDGSTLTEIRDVTDDEVAFFEDNGWLMLRGFFSAALAAELKRLAEPLLQEGEVVGGLRSTARPLSSHHGEPFASLVQGEPMGRAAHRLVNRARMSDAEIPTRFLDDLVWCKNPGGTGSTYHQDSGVEGADRIGRINFWVALEEVTPEMGAMRFVTKSHREGPLGWPDTFASDNPEHPLLTHYNKLLDIYDWSPPFHYHPGDATVHKGWTIHGGPPNATDRERWCYIIEYTAADTRYRNAQYHDSDIGVPLNDEDRYPVVYPRSVHT
jgi:ectoine hydroxylase-related dioxygenase (phytanoyl-CoA dioxygenase family)